MTTTATVVLIKQGSPASIVLTPTSTAPQFLLPFRATAGFVAQRAKSGTLCPERKRLKCARILVRAGASAYCVTALRRRSPGERAKVPTRRKFGPGVSGQGREKEGQREGERKSFRLDDLREIKHRGYFLRAGRQGEEGGNPVINSSTLSGITRRQRRRT